MDQADGVPTGEEVLCEEELMQGFLVLAARSVLALLRSRRKSGSILQMEDGELRFSVLAAVVEWVPEARKLLNPR